MPNLPPPDLELLHAAALDAALWPAALARVARHMGASGMLLHRMAPVPEDSLMHVAGLDPGLTRLYLERYQVNPLSALLGHRRPGEIIPTMRVVGERLRGTEFHADILLPQRIEEQVALVYGAWTDAISGGYAFSFEKRGAEDVDRRIAAIAAATGPLLRALDLACHFSRAATQSWTALLGTAEGPTMLTDAEGRLLLANAAAEAMLRRGDRLTLRDRRLLACHPADQARLREALRLVAGAPLGDGPRGRIALRCPAGEGLPCLAVLAPAPALPVDEIGLPRPAVLLMLTDPETGPDPAALREVFDLTPAEARIAAAIARGLPLRAAAGEAGVAHSTGRSHLRAAFDKIGVRSQSALAAVLARLPRDPRRQR
ncbi:helix-turn-helix transcriptional regulator [Siccirubricoccus phaeus]|uniref:helix-turn-helix transcriptional regulator n=1 Tax=Siccirubricoccus phaeus TaxID=2595053 RepID=UPI0011F1B501|nr:hypothetical protein [Siccirubricoccus phaeus]